MSKEIVVVQAGWVLLGDVTETAYGVKIHNASVVDTWGTTKGLGQIALEGPTKSTVLEYAGDVEVPTVSTLFRIKCTY